MQRTNDAGLDSQTVTLIPVRCGAACFVVSPQMLERSLGLPVGISIIGAEWNFSYGGARLYVTGPGLPERIEGGPICEVRPTLHEVVDGDGKKTTTWDWHT